jgi:hypothetical protein
MTTRSGPSNNLAAGGDYKVYVSGGTPDIDSADINVAESYAGFDRVAKPCHMIIYTGGALVATKSDGTEVTLPASLAGIPLPIEVWVINGSDAGTTATAALVIW